ncbi:MAG TPA: YihY family inner membrane protein [Gammaproteobacteria bacterium]|nr:YihY family inner membrane protein [Gammaproteobacteria bacterium]
MKLLTFFILAAKRLIKEDYAFRASALAYSTLLTLVPLLSVALFLLTLFPIFNKIRDLTGAYLAENFLPASSGAIQNYLHNFIMQAVNLPLTSIMFLAVFVILLVITIDGVMNDIWETERHKKKLIAFVLRWLVITVTPFIIGISVFLSSYLFSANWFLEITNRLGIKIPQLFIVSLTIDTVVFGIFYIIVPKHRILWRDGFAGGFLTAVLFGCAKGAFGFYIEHFSNYSVIYGAIAIVPIFLIWLYIYWLIILYGALFVYERYKWRLNNL